MKSIFRSVYNKCNDRRVKPGFSQYNNTHHDNLFENLIELINEETSAETLLMHPLFWDVKTVILFIIDCVGILRRNRETDAKQFSSLVTKILPERTNQDLCLIRNAFAHYFEENNCKYMDRDDYLKGILLRNPMLVIGLYKVMMDRRFQNNKIVSKLMNLYK